MGDLVVVETPTVLPGCCLVCNSPNRESFVDTGNNIDYHGAVYICVTCVDLMAGLYGYILPEAAIEIERKARELEKTNYEQQILIANLRQAIDGLGSAGYLPNATSLLDTELALVSSNEVADEELPATTGDVEQGENRPTEQSSSEGLADLHTTSGSNPDFKFDI